ncbi:MAG: hypothetical protein R2845_05985 [Thermomicrobiales bacterium]
MEQVVVGQPVSEQFNDGFGALRFDDQRFVGREFWPTLLPGVDRSSPEVSNER